MSIEEDFNITDEDPNLEPETGDPSAVHAGEEIDHDDPPEDRGDVVDGGEGEHTESDGGGDDDGHEADPEFLESLAGEGEGKPPKSIPYARFAEKAARNQELAAQNEQLLAALQAAVSGRGAAPEAEPEPQAPAFDMKAKVRERNAALLEGDEDKAAEIDMEIEEWRNIAIRAAARQEAMADFTAAQQKADAADVVAEAFNKYTFLNDQSDDYNAEALEDVMMYRERYMREGDSLPDALEKAINKVCPMYAGDDGAAEPAAPASTRSRGKVLRNARAARSQPPQVSRAGTANKETIDAAKLDIENMDEDKFDALPEDVKARLRGDVVA